MDNRYPNRVFHGIESKTKVWVCVANSPLWEREKRDVTMLRCV